MLTLTDTLKKIYFTGSKMELSPLACAYARARGTDRKFDPFAYHPVRGGGTRPRSRLQRPTSWAPSLGLWPPLEDDSVPERDDGDAAEEVQVPPALDVPDPEAVFT